MIPFNRPSYGQRETEALARVMASGYTAGNGAACKEAEAKLSSMLGGASVLLTTSCTHALELAADLMDIRPGDEVIVPSFTFTSTAAAFSRAGAKIVFCDVDPQTLGVDAGSLQSRITPRTRAVVVVHYAGVAPDLPAIIAMCDNANIMLIEDNAHGLGGRFEGRPLGTFGRIATQSFHETKNVSCGEGGAIVLNDPLLVERAEVLREKGTDRARFLRGQVDKYTWIEAGSSWVVSDLLAGILAAQLDRFADIQKSRHHVWNSYASGLSTWAGQAGAVLPDIVGPREHPAHLFHLLLPSLEDRDRFIAHMRDRGVMAVFHYQALHLSPYGSRLHDGTDLPVSVRAAETLVRLPLFADMSDGEISAVIEAVTTFR